METLNERREKLCLNFAQKCVKNPRTTHMFPKNIKTHDMKTRKGNIFQVSERLKKSNLESLVNNKPLENTESDDDWFAAATKMHEQNQIRLEAKQELERIKSKEEKSITVD